MIPWGSPFRKPTLYIYICIYIYIEKVDNNCITTPLNNIGSLIIIGIDVSKAIGSTIPECTIDGRDFNHQFWCGWWTWHCFTNMINRPVHVWNIWQANITIEILNSEIIFYNHQIIVHWAILLWRYDPFPSIFHPFSSIFHPFSILDSSIFSWSPVKNQAAPLLLSPQLTAAAQAFTEALHRKPRHVALAVQLPRPGYTARGGDSLWLRLTVRHGFSMALIEIDGLPNWKMGGSFHGYVSHNQMVDKAEWVTSIVHRC